MCYVWRSEVSLGVGSVLPCGTGLGQVGRLGDESHCAGLSITATEMTAMLLLSSHSQLSLPGL